MSNPTDNLGLQLPNSEGDSGKIAKINAAFQVIDALFPSGAAAAWASWTPTWTNLTVGNASVVAKYAQVGKLVFCRLSLVFGNTTSISGDVIFTLPVTRAAYGGSATATPLGLATLFDVGTAAYLGQIANHSTTQGALRVLGSAGSYANVVVVSSTVPFTWTTSDEICAEFFYEAA